MKTEFTENGKTIVFYQKENDEKYSFLVKGDEYLTNELRSKALNKRVRVKDIPFAVKSLFSILVKITNPKSLYPKFIKDEKRFLEKMFDKRYEEHFNSIGRKITIDLTNELNKISLDERYEIKYSECDLNHVINCLKHFKYINEISSITKIGQNGVIVFENSTTNTDKIQREIFIGVVVNRSLKSYLSNPKFEIMGEIVSYSYLYNSMFKYERLCYELNEINEFSKQVLKKF